jgi:hypothetical protein
MPATGIPRRRAAAPFSRLAVSALLAALLAGCAEPAEPAAGAAAAAGSAREASSTPGTGGGDAAAAARRVLPASTPTRLRIQRIGVDTRLVRLDIQRDGTMEVPEDYAQAGWYRHAPTPGERGPAIIAGHVDSRDGPAVFHRLRELRPGDRVQVHRSDRTIAEFEIEQVRSYPKDAFPTARVYGDLDHAGLRLITCGGTFDRATRHYRDNVVAYARLAGQRSGDR